MDVKCQIKYCPLSFQIVRDFVTKEHNLTTEVLRVQYSLAVRDLTQLYAFE